MGWNGFGISEPVWAVIIIIVGFVIGVAAMLKNQDIAYGLVIIWAYAGIWLKHISASGFSGQYPAIITTVIACIVLLFIVEAFILLTKKTRLI